MKIKLGKGWTNYGYLKRYENENLTYEDKYLDFDIVIDGVPLGLRSDHYEFELDTSPEMIRAFGKKLRELANMVNNS